MGNDVYCPSTTHMNLHDEMLLEVLSNIVQLQYLLQHMHAPDSSKVSEKRFKILLSFFFRLGGGTCVTSSLDILVINS